MKPRFLLIPLSFVFCALALCADSGHATQTTSTAGTATAAQAFTPEARFEQAGRLYAKARYNEAAEMYEHLIAKGFASKEVYANLGSARFKSGRLAESMLAFQRAARLDPADPDLQHNIQVATARLQDRVAPIPLLFAVQWWNDLKNGHTAETLFTWTLVLAWFVAAAVFVFFGYSHLLLRRAALAAGLVFGGLFIACVALYVDKVEDVTARRAAVVMQPQIPVRSTADASGVESFVIHEGLTVEILEEQGRMSHIRLADGKDGWIPSDAIERI